MRNMRRAVPVELAIALLVCAACSSESSPNDHSTTGGGGHPAFDGGPADPSPEHVPTDCPNATEDGYSILDDPNYATYQIRKVGAVSFSRYETDASGKEIVVSEDYQVVTAFPKRYTLSEVHQGKTFPMEDKGGYYAVDSEYAIPNIPCVTDEVIYAPIVKGYSEPEVIQNGQNKGWPIQEDISAEVAKYAGTDKMWVYTTWPGYRYGYWFRDDVGVRPTWLFSVDHTTNDVSFKTFSPSDTTWPEGAYNGVNFGLNIDSGGKVYIPKVQPIDFPQQNGQPPPPKDVKLAYKNWDSELRCVVINKSSAIIASSRTIWPGGSEAYYPAESFLPGYAVIGQDSDRYWGLKGKETDEAAWWAGDDCVGNACSGQSRMPYRNGCSIDGYDFGQGDGFNWLALKDHMIDIGVIIGKEKMYRIQVYLQDDLQKPARMLAELYYEQDDEGRWQPRLTPGTHTYDLTGGDNPRYIVNGHIYSGQRVFAVLRDL